MCSVNLIVLNALSVIGAYILEMKIVFYPEDQNEDFNERQFDIYIEMISGMLFLLNGMYMLAIIYYSAQAK